MKTVKISIILMSILILSCTYPYWYYDKYDENFTSNLLINTTSLGLEFCDHIIIGHDTYFSFAEQGVMQRLKLKVEKKLR